MEEITKKLIGFDFYHNIKSSDRLSSAAMRGMPTVSMPVLTLFTNITRERTVMTIYDRPLVSTAALDSAARPFEGGSVSCEALC